MGSRNLDLGKIEGILMSSGSPANTQSNGSRNIRPSNGPEWGNYTPYCNGLIVVGPERDNLVCSISGLIFLGVVIALQFDVLVDNVGKFHAVSLVVVHILTSISFLVTSLSDPGVIPKHQQLPSNWFQLEQYKRDVAGGHRPRYCRICETVRPPRTYHCEKCDVCVHRQDMHLFIGGICVGERNFVPYMFLNTLQVFLGCYLVTLNAVIFSKFSGNPRHSLKVNPKEIIITVVSFFFGFLILVAPQTGILIFPYRFYLIAKDRSFREEFRLLKHLNSGRPRAERSCWENWLSFLTTKRRVESCFRRDLRQVDNIGQQRLDFLMPSVPSPPYSVFRLRDPNTFPGQSAVVYDKNNNRVHQHHLARVTTLEETKHVPQRKRDLCINLRQTAKAKRNEFCQSEPTLSRGELLPMLPGDRIRMEVNSRPSTALQKRIKRFQEVQEMPKPFVDFHIHHQEPSSLSEGSFPRTRMTPEAVNEMLQLARATQIRRLIEYVLARDRQGLVRMARRVNMGGILGVPGGLDTDNLQIIEVNRQGQGQMRQRPVVRVPYNAQENLPRARPIVNAPVGLTQLVAAGLLERVQGRLARHLTPENLNIIRGYHNHDNGRTTLRGRERSPTGERTVRSLLPPMAPQRLTQSPITTTTTNNREYRNTNISPVLAEPAQRSYAGLSQPFGRPNRNVSISPALPTGGSQLERPTITENEANNNPMAIVFVNTEHSSTSQTSGTNLLDVDENQNQSIQE